MRARTIHPTMFATQTTVHFLLLPTIGWARGGHRAMSLLYAITWCVAWLNHASQGDEYVSGAWSSNALGRIDVCLVGFTVTCTAGWMLARGHVVMSLVVVAHVCVVWTLIQTLWTLEMYAECELFHAAFHHTVPCVVLGSWLAKRSRSVAECDR